MFLPLRGVRHHSYPLMESSKWQGACQAPPAVCMSVAMMMHGRGSPWCWAKFPEEGLGGGLVSMGLSISGPGVVCLHLLAHLWEIHYWPGYGSPCTGREDHGRRWAGPGCPVCRASVWRAGHPALPSRVGRGARGRRPARNQRPAPRPERPRPGHDAAALAPSPPGPALSPLRSLGLPLRLNCHRKQLLLRSPARRRRGAHTATGNNCYCVHPPAAVRAATDTIVRIVFDPRKCSVIKFLGRETSAPEKFCSAPRPRQGRYVFGAPRPRAPAPQCPCQLLPR